MPKVVLFIILLHLLVNPGFGQINHGKYALAIHGGAGVMSKERMSEEMQKRYIIQLDRALQIGDSVLKAGGTSREAVVNVITFMEDCPLFNAGKGAVLTSEGKTELDASIMDGETLTAGAIAGVTDIKNPIQAALKVMEESEHVMLSGKGASEFARSKGLNMVSNSYFRTKERSDSFRNLKKKEKEEAKIDKHGTVGCVALDRDGNICAGTSTGGMMNKRYGRIGDSPIIGAGTWADNNTCAVSCTGHGEYFIRLTFARDIAAHMEYKNLSLIEAGGTVLGKLTQMGGTGGFIAIDQSGNIIMPFNTSGMFRGYVKSDGEKEIAIFRPE
ncbi:MAG TPA: beta-aspartyl-peptidase [Prolixibacteraceae bacterium]|nr:beta-aspartyl-peptidase [Prolixibacteraceae bacterium]